MALFGRAMRGPAASGPTNGHNGVAAWVAANSADVLAYWPCEDAAASGTMADLSGNARDGTYGSNVTTGSVNGETVAAVATSNNIAAVTYGSWMNSQVALFAVCEFANSGASFHQIVSRDDETGGQRTYQFRFDVANTRLQFVKASITQGSTQGGTISYATDYTVGWWWDGTDARVYIDGSHVGSATAMADPTTTTARMTFGFKDAPATNPILGALGSVVALSAAGSSTIADLHDAWVNGYP